MNARKRVFRLPLSRSRIDADLHEEFRFHIEERIEQFVAEGMSREEAEREVERRFGDYETHRTLTRQIDEDTMHRRHRSERLRDIRREVTLAARTLRRTPGFTLIASLTLAIGLGATVAIFSVLDAVVLRPLAYRNADALVSVLHPAVVPGSGERRWGLSPGGYFFLRANNASLADLAMYRNTGFPVTNGGEAEMTQVAQVTASIFPVLQARPAAGRLLTEADDKPGAPKVVVLSHEFLQRRFGGDLAMVGRNLETSAGTFEIVGVAEPGLVLPMPGPFASTANLSGFGVDVWIPMQLNPAGPFYNNHPYVGIGRLKPGVAPAAAQRDLERLFARFPEVLPDVYSAKFVENYNFRIEASPLRDAVLGPKVPRVLWMLFAAVSLVLVIAAANVSNLFLVRMEARRREAAIRVALGADRVHMSTHYLAETLLLCIGAAIVGVGIAAAGLQLLMAVAPTDIPRLATSAIDGRAVTVALTVALALSLLLGLAPLLRRTTDLGVLREAGRGLSPSRGQRAVRNSLVIGQIALALMLLSAAGVMLRSFDRLRDVQPGFDATGVLTFEVSLPYTEFTTREEALGFHREFDRRLRELPGVTAVGSTGVVPLEGYGSGCSVVFREGLPYAVGEETPCVATPTVLPGFFDALLIPVQGSKPTWSDVDARTQAVVVTKALADRLWPGISPVGKGIGSNGPDSRAWYRVVGVVPHIKAEALDQPPTEAVFYAPTGLRPGVKSGDLNDVAYMVRMSTADPMTATAGIRTILSSMNPRVPFIDARSMEDVVARSMARTSFLMLLLGVAAAVALLLSAVGLYGVVSYVVTLRRSELGIRMALGASARHVVRLVLVQSAWLAVVGVTIGLAATLAASRTLQSVVYEVSPADPAVLGSVMAVLLVVALCASLLPARRAARIDPGDAMRES